MAKSLRSKVKRAVRAERRIALAKSPVEAKRQGNRDAAMAKILEAAALRREQAKLDGATMDIEPPSTSSAAAAAANANGSSSNAKTALDNARTTDEVSWSKIGIRAGSGVNVKSLRYTTRSRGKCRGPRKVIEVGSVAQSHGETGKLNSGKKQQQPSKTSFLFPVNPKNKKRRRTNIFTRHG